MDGRLPAAARARCDPRREARRHGERVAGGGEAGKGAGGRAGRVCSWCCGVGAEREVVRLGWLFLQLCR